MSTRSKKLLAAALVVAGIYAVTPFVAGLLKTYDRRGPKIFAQRHHDILYKFGYYLAGHHYRDGKPRVPFMQERSWFYGVEGKQLPQP